MKILISSPVLYCVVNEHVGNWSLGLRRGELEYSSFCG